MLPSHKTHIASSYHFLSSAKICPSFLETFVFSDEVGSYWVTAGVLLMLLASKRESAHVIDVTFKVQICF